MLSHLGIKNFTTVDSLEIELTQGLTTITGETGAGKSVLLDAIGLAMGSRSTGKALRNINKNAEITATLYAPNGGSASQWLTTKDLLAEPAAPMETTTKPTKSPAKQLKCRAKAQIPATEIEIILRRVIMPNGRNRAYINGVAVNIAELKQLGCQLVDLHNQHEHQSLLNTATHGALLDDFAGHQATTKQVVEIAKQWSKLESSIRKLKDNNEAKEAQLQLLRYQIEELNQLALKDNESTALAAEQKQLANAESIIVGLNIARECCESSDASSALNQVQLATQSLSPHLTDLPALASCIALLNSAQIQIEEASLELNAVAESITPNPARLQEIESRLDAIYTIARKHKVEPESLIETFASMQQQIDALCDNNNKIELLEAQKNQLEIQYLSMAKKLSQSRKRSATKLSKLVNQKLSELKMGHCEFVTTLKPRETLTPFSTGQETIEFLISTIPGKPPQALAKIASGGELSRISLAIQVVTAQTSDIPTLVFDEVDVGIGGSVAEVVGNMLRDLSQSTQVLCVTHLAQVAAKGKTHLLVNKALSKTSATTHIEALDEKSRANELARMMGGLEVTDSTIAHATEMLETA